MSYFSVAHVWSWIHTASQSYFDRWLKFWKARPVVAFVLNACAIGLVIIIHEALSPELRRTVLTVGFVVIFIIVAPIQFASGLIGRGWQQTDFRLGLTFDGSRRGSREAREDCPPEQRDADGHCRDDND